MKLVLLFACFSSVLSLSCYYGFIKHPKPLRIEEYKGIKICRRAWHRNTDEEWYHGQEYYPTKEIKRLMEANPGKEQCTIEITKDNQLFNACYCYGDQCNTPFPPQNRTLRH